MPRSHQFFVIGSLLGKSTPRCKELLLERIGMRSGPSLTMKRPLLRFAAFVGASQRSVPVGALYDRYSTLGAWRIVPLSVMRYGQ